MIFQPKHGTAERWDTCDCIECRRATWRPIAPALRAEVAAMLKAAADKADEWRKAARDEWAPLAPDYHAGDGEVTPAIEGPYIEHRLAMHIGNDIRRMFDQLDPDIPTLRTDSPKPPPLSQGEAEDIARAGIEAYKDAEANCGRIIALTEEDLGAAAIAGQNALEAREPGRWSVRAAVIDERRRVTFVVKRCRSGDAP